MPYVLGVDVGNSHTTAALAWHDVPGAIVVPLDEGSSSVHSVLYLSGDDTVRVGRDALAMAESDPERIARGLVARVGDPIAPLLGGRPCPAEILLASLVCWVVDRAVEQQDGNPPERIVVTHPAGWGPHRRAVLDQALRQAGLSDVLLLPKPLAAAENYAAGHPVRVGDAVAVYDLGEDAVACALTRLGPAGFELLGHAESAESVGGGHFDDLLAGQVLAELGRAEVDPFDEELRPVIAALRADCRAAKETLSNAEDAVVPTPALGPPSSVLLTRARFEELITASVHEREAAGSHRCRYLPRVHFPERGRGG